MINMQKMVSIAGIGLDLWAGHFPLTGRDLRWVLSPWPPFKNTKQTGSTILRNPQLSEIFSQIPKATLSPVSVRTFVQPFSPSEALAIKARGVASDWPCGTMDSTFHWSCESSANLGYLPILSRDPSFPKSSLNPGKTASFRK